MSSTATHTCERSPTSSVVSMALYRSSKGRRGKAGLARLLAAVAIAGVLALLASGFVESGLVQRIDRARRGVEFEVVTVTVRSGDTLWSLAREYGPGGVDIRETIDWIQRENGLSTPVLRPGQRIVVPVGLRE